MSRAKRFVSVGSLEYVSYDLSLEVTELGLTSGRLWCSQDVSSVMPRKELRDKSSLRLAR